MFILTRYFQTEQYQSEFMAGSVYASSMSKFTEIVPERGLKEAVESESGEAKGNLSSGQKDVMEGTIADLSMDALPFLKMDGIDEIVIGDPKARAAGYSYCNIVCFNQVPYSKFYDMTTLKPPMREPSRVFYDVEEPTPMARDFGNYAVIILDMKAFLNRIIAAADRNWWSVVAGPVNYHPLMLGNKKITRVNGNGTMTLLIDLLFPLQSFIDTDMAVINERDAFDKWDQHAIEKEFRLAIKTGEKSKTPVRLEIGDISDIAVPVKADAVRKSILNLLAEGEIKPSTNDYVGNISREQMKQDFYEMGDGMVNIVLVCGGIAEYEEIN